MCWVGHPDGEKAWLLASVVSLVLGIGILFVPLFGQFISPLLLLLSFSFFLLYLRVLARSSNCESLAKRFVGRGYQIGLCHLVFRRYRPSSGTSMKFVPT